MKVMALSAALMLIAVAAQAETKFYEPRKLTNNEKTIIEKAVRDQLKDPQAAQFRWYKFNGHSHYCGEVNGKNSYGGYIGFARFRVDVVLDPGGQITSASKPDILTRPTSDRDGLVTDVLSKLCLASAIDMRLDKPPPPVAE